MFSSRIWREKPQRYRLEAAKCKKTGQVYFPPRLVTSGDLNSRDFEKIDLPWEGTVVSYTVIRTPPTPFIDDAPYCIAIVNLMKGVRVTCQVVDVDFEELAIGMKVKLEFRKIQGNGEDGVLCYGYKAVPVTIEVSE